MCDVRPVDNLSGRFSSVARLDSYQASGLIRTFQTVFTPFRATVGLHVVF